MTPKKIALIAAGLALLLLAGVGGLYLGTKLGRPSATQTEAPTRPTAEGPGSVPHPADCGPSTQSVEQGTVSQPPTTTWKQLAPKDAKSTGALMVPETAGGPFKSPDGANVPKCFAPSPTGALTAAYYMWAMTDARLPIDVRRASLEAYVPRDREGRDEYLSTTLKSPRRINVTGIRLSVPVTGSTAEVEAQLEFEGRTITAHTALRWTGTTWVEAPFAEAPQVQSPLMRWAP